MKRLQFFLFVLFFFFPLLFAEGLDGLWENADRLMEFTADNQKKVFTVKTALKTYYRYFYDVMPDMTVVSQTEKTENTLRIIVRYADYRKPTYYDVFITPNYLFTSFFQKLPLNNTDAASKNSLEGFWIERGNRTGIRTYPQDPPDFFDAYFFENNRYVRFRYWKDDYEFQPVQALITGFNDTPIRVPKYLRRDEIVYTCITANNRVLRNYESGTYIQTRQENSRDTLTLMPQSAGPGTDAVSDVYPHIQMPVVENETVQLSTDGLFFALGEPFLIRSTEDDFASYVRKHNEKRRPPREPDLKSDEIDFFWDRIDQIRNKRIP